MFRAKAVLRPGGRHPDAPWTLGMAAGLTGDPRASPGVSANDAAGESDGDAAGDDPDDDDETEDDIDYTKVYISRNRQYLLWKARMAKNKKSLETAGRPTVRSS